MTPDQRATLLRYFYTAAGSASAMLLLLGMDQADVKRIVDAIRSAGETLTTILAIVSLLVTIAATLRGVWRAGVGQQMARVDKIDGVEVKVDPLAAPASAIAAANDPALPNVTLKEP